MISNSAEIDENQTNDSLFNDSESLKLPDKDTTAGDKTLENPEDELIDPKNFESKVQIFDILRQDNCIHEVAVPLSLRYTPNNERKEPVKTFPFNLDPFQEQAINCLDNSQSVLVSAHTSAGKTVVALYAVALALKANQRVVYTTPIKALSNQKYRELCEQFDGDVGLMTGDVTLNPQASCLVMTTEILRSMLYRGSDIMREIGWVIFDEIHYMNNEERGVVWEESIVLLSDNVHYVFLSATIPNAKQFASWIANLHNQICHIVYTDYRPTPLQHFFFTKGSNGLYEIVSAEGEFRESNFAKAISFVEGIEEAPKKKRLSGVEKQAIMDQNESELKKLIRTIQQSELLPCIVFSFARKDCERFAASLDDIDFNDDDKKELIREIFNNAISLLSEQDRKLQQIKWILPFLLRGIGIHHSGLLPLLKECIEILFGEGLIQILFATETFAMGLNMPARTVVFTSARKFDGRTTRWMSGSEYIQMSGRAGRRGTDDKGIAILMVDQKMSADVVKQLMMGKSDPLTSRFRLTYNMVLNLVRVTEISPQYMVERSFRYFQDRFLLPDLYKKWQNKKEKYEALDVELESEFQEYCELEKTIEETKQRICKTMFQPKYLVPFLNEGRLLKIRNLETNLGWGVLLSVKKTIDKLGNSVHLLKFVLRVSWDSVKDIENVDKLRPPPPNQSGSLAIVTLNLDWVDGISSLRIKVPTEETNQELFKTKIDATVQKALDKYNNVIPELDPKLIVVDDNRAFYADLDNMKLLENQLAENELRKRPDFNQLYESYKQKSQLKEEADSAKNELMELLRGEFYKELESRKRVLRTLGFIDKHSITQKGRIACEINAADPILLTEMLMSGAFNDLSPSACAALFSCFVFDERTEEKPNLDENLQKALNEAINYARKVAQVSNECNVELVESEYIEKLQSGIMSVVQQWCSGVSFEEITRNCQIFEGSIIRCLRRLEELLREAVLAAKAMGSDKLQEKFTEASVSLKRDIVFAASLYL